WSSDVCSSDLRDEFGLREQRVGPPQLANESRVVEGERIINPLLLHVRFEHGALDTRLLKSCSFSRSLTALNELLESPGVSGTVHYLSVVECDLVGQELVDEVLIGVVRVVRELYGGGDSNLHHSGAGENRGVL